MKKVLVLFTLLVVLAIAKPTFAAEIPVFIDSIQVNFTDAVPEMIDGHVMFPMRILFEKLGAEVQWDNDTRTATAKKEKTIVSLSIGNKIAKLNGTETRLDSAPITMHERTYVPIRFVAESLGAKVYWNNDTRAVYIYSAVYLSDMNQAKLKILLNNKFNNKIKTTLGDIDVANTVIKSDDTNSSLYDYFILSAINQFTVETILKNTSYTTEQKTQFKEELRMYLKSLSTYTLDLTSGTYKIVGGYRFSDGYEDAAKQKPIIKAYYNWANFDYMNEILDGKGFRWAPEVDTYQFK